MRDRRYSCPVTTRAADHRVAVAPSGGRSASTCPMDFRDTPAEAEFRDEVRTWLAEHLVGEFRAIGGRGGPADEDNYDLRIEWERVLGRDRWVGMSWPTEY